MNNNAEQRLRILHYTLQGERKMTNRQIKKIVKQYVKRLPDGLSYYAVKYDFEHRGWKVILFNTESGDQVLEQLSSKLLHYAKTTKGFLYEGTTACYVGIDANLSISERLEAMLHEAAHIECGHELSLDYDDEAEAEANAFAKLALNYQPSFWKQHHKFIAVCAICVAGSAACGLYYLAAQFTGQHATPASNDIPAMTAPSNKSEQDGQSTVQNSEDTIVYCTTGGDKYHKQDCTIIKNKTNVFSLKLSEAAALRG